MIFLLGVSLMTWFINEWSNPMFWSFIMGFNCTLFFTRSIMLPTSVTSNRAHNGLQPVPAATGWYHAWFNNLSPQSDLFKICFEFFNSFCAWCNSWPVDSRYSNASTLMRNTREKVETGKSMRITGKWERRVWVESISLNATLQVFSVREILSTRGKETYGKAMGGQIMFGCSRKFCK